MSSWHQQMHSNTRSQASWHSTKCSKNFISIFLYNICMRKYHLFPKCKLCLKSDFTRHHQRRSLHKCTEQMPWLRKSHYQQKMWRRRTARDRPRKVCFFLSLWWISREDDFSGSPRQYLSSHYRKQKSMFNQIDFLNSVINSET